MTFVVFAVVLPKSAQSRPNSSNYSMIAVDSAAPAADDGDDVSLDLCDGNKVEKEASFKLFYLFFDYLMEK